MSIHHISRMRNAAIAVFVSATVLSTASADSTASSTDSVQSAHQPKERVAACRTIDRPKHTIRVCPCSPSAFSGVASIDAGEILRLLTGDHSCRSTTAP